MTSANELSQSMVAGPGSALDVAGEAVLGALVPADTSKQLFRMFRDPRVLEKHERTEIIEHLKRAIEVAPHKAEIRVLLGMALCVDLQAQEALEQLRIAAESAPACFIARLKYGELLMRLRICSKAADETHQAAILATNPVQSDLARRQAATIRTMMREGIERGGYHGLLPRLFRLRQKTPAGSTALAGTK